MRQIKFFLIVIILTFLTGGFILYQLLKSQVMEFLGTLPGFEKCIKASSFIEYFEKAGVTPMQDLKEHDWEKLSPINIPLQINFSEIQIYQIPIGQAGGDVLTKAILKFKNKYCELTDSNFQILFAPIEKDEVIKYLEFRLITLASSAYGRCRTTILKEEEYSEKWCLTDKLEGKEKKITTLQETKDGFLVDWIYYTSCAPSGFYEVRIKVKKNGELKVIDWPQQPFIPCGPGIMF